MVKLMVAKLARDFELSKVQSAFAGTKKLLRAGSSEYHGNGFGEDLEIEPEGPIVDVFEVEPHPFAKVALVLAAPKFLNQSCTPPACQV